MTKPVTMRGCSRPGRAASCGTRIASRALYPARWFEAYSVTTSQSWCGLRGAEKTACGVCGRGHPSYYDKRLRRIRDLSCGDKRVYLEVELRRVAFRTCGKFTSRRSTSGTMRHATPMHRSGSDSPATTEPPGRQVIESAPRTAATTSRYFLGGGAGALPSVSAPACAHWLSCGEDAPLTPIAPTILPSMISGMPPSTGVTPGMPRIA